MLDHLCKLHCHTTQEDIIRAEPCLGNAKGQHVERVHCFHQAKNPQDPGSQKAHCISVRTLKSHVWIAKKRLASNLIFNNAKAGEVCLTEHTLRIICDHAASANHAGSPNQSSPLLGDTGICLSTVTKNKGTPLSQRWSRCKFQKASSRFNLCTPSMLPRACDPVQKNILKGFSTPACVRYKKYSRAQAVTSCTSAPACPT